MCLTWTRNYTLCGCIREITTTNCPPSQQSNCEGEKITFLQTDSVTCKTCWRRGDKRTLIKEDDTHEPYLNDDGYEADTESSSTSESSRHSTAGSRDELGDETRYSSDAVEYKLTSTDEPEPEPEPEDTDSDPNYDIFYDAVEYLSSAGQAISEENRCPLQVQVPPPQTSTRTRTPDYDADSESEEYFDEECASPRPDSRPSTPFLDLRHPEWLDIVGGVDASRVCRPVERVYPHYRADPGSSREQYLTDGGFFLIILLPNWGAHSLLI